MPLDILLMEIRDVIIAKAWRNGFLLHFVNASVERRELAVEYMDESFVAQYQAKAAILNTIQESK